MITRSASLLAALRQRWTYGCLRDPAFARLALHCYPAYPRYSSTHRPHLPEKTVPVSRSELSTPGEPAFPSLELKLARSRASRDGGRSALNILEALDDEDASILYLKGLECLQCYRDHISPLSIPDARRIIAEDGAGTRVWRWIMQPAIRHQIEENHPDNK